MRVACEWRYSTMGCVCLPPTAAPANRTKGAGLGWPGRFNQSLDVCNNGYVRQASDILTTMHSPNPSSTYNVYCILFSMSAYKWVLSCALEMRVKKKCRDIKKKKNSSNRRNINFYMRNKEAYIVHSLSSEQFIVSHHQVCRRTCGCYPKRYIEYNVFAW